MGRATIATAPPNLRDSYKSTHEIYGGQGQRVNVDKGDAAGNMQQQQQKQQQQDNPRLAHRLHLLQWMISNGYDATGRQMSGVFPNAADFNRTTNENVDSGGEI